MPLPVLTAPDGRRFAWDDPALPGALAEDLGREVTLRRDPALMPDLPDSVLVTTQATLDAVRAALGRPWTCGASARTSTSCSTPPPTPRRAGRAARCASATRAPAPAPLRALRHPHARPRHPAKDPEVLRWLTREHGGLFGINARALGPGRVAVGDAVELA